ncbi:Pre-mRNA-splicing factor SPF27 [Mrakia frigida]|uniref:pre-mRNA-splicing factor SPF27 family protein n=1 Tax=Mrakia frigida TaxID=29902 RepID=UPI003FCBFB9A
MSSSTTPHDSADSIDSLPYIDRDLEDVPGLRETAESLIQAEMAKMGGVRAEHPRLPKGPEKELFEDSPGLSSLLANYPDQPLSALDRNRYQLPAPTSENPTEEEWKAASLNARAQVEHLGVRQTNLSLLTSFGPNAHLIHNHLLTADAAQLEATVATMKEELVEINRKRKNHQVEASKVLERLEGQWTQLISSTLQTELANAALEAEVEQLRRKERDLGLA